MADSVTHEEFFKKQNKQQGMSPTDTETTMEDMQETIIQVQDSLKMLTNKTIQDRVHQYKEQQAVKTSMEGMKQKIEVLESEISQLRNSNEEPSENSISKLQTHKEDPEDSDSSVWEISSTSSDSEN